MINIEIKAKCNEIQQSKIREILTKEATTIIPAEQQIDTYLNVNHCRLKIRESKTENFLVQYDRPNDAGPKTSKYNLVPITPDSKLKESLINSLGVKIIVDKTREVFYINNIKFHLDFILDLGYFVEIEARDETETIGIDLLNYQCNYWMKVFEIQEKDLINNSYSDLLDETLPGSQNLGENDVVTYFKNKLFTGMNFTNLNGE